MIISESARAHRKQQQLDRLALKERVADPDDPATTDDYRAFYAAQPLQVVKANALAPVIAARQELRAAEATLKDALGTGEGVDEALTRKITATVDLTNKKLSYADLFARGGIQISDGSET